MYMYMFDEVGQSKEEFTSNTCLHILPRLHKEVAGMVDDPHTLSGLLPLAKLKV